MQGSRSSKKRYMAIVLPLVLFLMTVLPGTAASTVKALSTNFTLVNLGTDLANLTIDYILPDGSSWKTSDTATGLAVGGQVVYRQYLDTNLTNGRGSVVVNSSQPMGAVVQIQARGQTPTSGAYSGLSAGSSKFYVPLAARRQPTASGIANSQIIIQNTGSTGIDVTVALVKNDGTTTYTKPITGVAGGASYLYDLEEETNLGEPWLGSAVVSVTTTGGTAAVVANFFTGSDGMQTFNAFPQESLSQDWIIPSFFSKLANGLNAPVTIQNVTTGTTINVGEATMTCKVDATSPSQTPATFNVSNTTAIGPGQSFAWNPVTSTTLPTTWLGSCAVHTSASSVAFVQLRFVGDGLSRSAAYEAVNSSSTATTVVVPLVAKRLGNGFASAVTIANLNASQAANVTLNYLPSSESGSQQTLSLTKQIPGGGSLIQNHRVDSSHPQGVALPDGWQGTLTIVSSDQPIIAFVQLDFLGQGGDPYMAHNAFTK